MHFRQQWHTLYRNTISDCKWSCNAQSHNNTCLPDTCEWCDGWTGGIWNKPSNIIYFLKTRNSCYFFLMYLCLFIWPFFQFSPHARRVKANASFFWVMWSATASFQMQCHWTAIRTWRRTLTTNSVISANQCLRWLALRWVMGGPTYSPRDSEASCTVLDS